MRIKIRTPLGNAEAKTPMERSNFLDDRIGFWANVESVNSQNNTVDVTADIGILYRNIPVMSREWVNVSDEKDYVTAERDLPPTGARVFVLTPTRTITGAFVLCSGFARGEEDTHTLYATSDDEQEEKNNTREKVTQGGWNETEDYANGNKNFVSADGNIKFAVNTKENSDKEQKKEVSLVAWENEIHITEEGMTINIPENANLTLNIEGDNSLAVKGNYSLSVEGDCSISAKGNCDVNSDKNVTVEAKSNCNVKGQNVKVEGNVTVTGGTCKIGGTVAPTGSGALCGIPVCPFTGAPHTGDTSSGT